MTPEDLNRLARLIIHMAAIIVWALSGRDQEVFDKVRELGTLKWEEIRGSD